MGLPLIDLHHRFTVQILLQRADRIREQRFRNIGGLCLNAVQGSNLRSGGTRRLRAGAVKAITLPLQYFGVIIPKAMKANRSNRPIGDQVMQGLLFNCI